ncbi:MAG: thioredoxin family protein [Candidatus Gastranaerophilaceae bacterium]
MKKNIIIVSLIFILPVIAYFILSDTQAISATKHKDGSPQIVKFSSKLCFDCKKLKKVFDEIVPNYDNEITVIEYDVQSNDTKTKKAIDDYNITLVPTVIFINRAGQEVKRTEGFVEKEMLEKHINEILK